MIAKSDFNEIFEKSLNFWKHVRNAKSHNGLIIEEDEVAILRKNQYHDCTAEINELFIAIKSIIEVSIHFITTKFFQEELFIYPLLVALYRKKFLPELKLIDYSIITRVKNPILKNRPAISKTFDFVFKTRESLYKIIYKIIHGVEIDNIKENKDSEVEDLVMLVLGFMANFTLVGIPLIMIDRIKEINDIVVEKNINITKEKILSNLRRSQVHTEHIVNNIVITIFSKLLRAEIPNEFYDIDIKRFEDNDFIERCTIFRKSLYLNAVRNSHASTAVAVLYLEQTYRVLMPLGYLIENFKDD